VRPARQRRARGAAGHTHGPTPRSSPAPTAGLLRVGSTGQRCPVATIEAWTWRQRPTWQAMRRPTLGSDTTEGVSGPVIRRRRRSWSRMSGRQTNGIMCPIEDESPPSRSYEEAAKSRHLLGSSGRGVASSPRIRPSPKRRHLCTSLVSNAPGAPWRSSLDADRTDAIPPRMEGLGRSLVGLAWRWL